MFARQQRLPRRGFTVLELIVVMGIIAILVSLLLPAVQNARGTARTVQCKNNLRNIGLAVIEETVSKQQFPVSGNFGKYAGDYHNWIVSILPWLEQSAIYDQWNFDEEFSHPDNVPLAQVVIPILICPDDLTVHGAGDLTYVVNGGVGWTGPPCGVRTLDFVEIDLNGSGDCTVFPDTEKPTDVDLMFRMGLFFADNWPERSPEIKHHTLDTIKDGVSNTIMITENIHAGYDSTADGNWANPVSWRTCFIMSPNICKDLSCVPGNVNYKLANDRTGANKDHSINALGQVEGKALWPSSFHRGGVNIVFADGRVHFLSENVDGAVYAGLLTPQGMLLPDPLKQKIHSDGDF